jgi:hypothetical protein
MVCEVHVVQDQEGTSKVKASHKLDQASVMFDDPNLVANAGLMLTGTLMSRLGLIETIDAKVKLAGRVGGANPGIKAATVVCALLAGADCIDDVDVLRAGASGQVCGHELRAPSTIGTWLRALGWGHVRQLDAAAGQLLRRAWAAGAGPSTNEPVTIDVDSTLCETYGLVKQGGRSYTRKHHRGYHPLLGVVAGYDQVVSARLREGVANDARGAKSFVAETIRRVRVAGARGKLTLRADSGFFARAVIDACPRGRRALLDHRQDEPLPAAGNRRDPRRRVDPDARLGAPRRASRGRRDPYPSVQRQLRPGAPDRAPGHPQDGQGR